MKNLLDELLIEIFKHVQYPISLALTSRQWARIAADPHAKALWLITHYGKAHALFHAVRLGPSFINVTVVRTLISHNIVISRYFIQRLLMHFGKYDEELISQKIEFGNDSIRALKNKITCAWASQLPLDVFTYLLSEGYQRFGGSNTASKGNDMELFHFLTAGPYVINHAPDKLKQNILKIEELIRVYHFVPLPPRPKPKSNDLDDKQREANSAIHEEYPPKDGYENVRQLNVIARAILIHPPLVKMWKREGYLEICADVNELVMQGALLILFPPNPTAEWEKPSAMQVEERLRQLEELNFKLTDSVIGDVFFLFEHRLTDIGDRFIEAFKKMRNQSINELVQRCLIEVMKPERILKNNNLLDFLYSLLKPKDFLDTFTNALIHHNIGPNLVSPPRSMTSVSNSKETETPQQERGEAIYYEASDYKQAFEYYLKSAHSGEQIATKFVLSSSSSLKAYVKLSPIVYRWALQIFGAPSYPVKLLFYDILRTRIAIRSLNLESESTDNNSLIGQVKNLYKEYTEAKVPYLVMHLSLLTKADDNELLLGFFDEYLPSIYSNDQKDLANREKKRKNVNFEQQKWSKILFAFRSGEKTRVIEPDYYGHLIEYDIESSDKFLDKIQTFKLREDIRYSYNSEKEVDERDTKRQKTTTSFASLG